MYTVGRLAKKFGLSRSTLLYYDSIGLLSPSHHTKGAYRYYTDNDAETLRRICMYRKTGLSLKSIARILSSKTTSETATVLEHRLESLNEEIASLQNQYRIVAELLQKSALPTTTPQNTEAWTTMFADAGLSTEEMRQWHTDFERTDPHEHASFLKDLHLPEKEIAMIRSWAAAPQSILKLQQASEEFMNTFFRFYENIERKGPGSFEETLRAFTLCSELPAVPKLLDIGCGSGANTVDLAHMSNANITCIDIYPPFVEETRQRALAEGLTNRITAEKQDMAKLPYEAEQFDIIWSEGAAYIMGFDAALTYWKQFLTSKGYLVISEAVWLKKTSSEDLINFWKEAYPAMRDTKSNINAIKKAGYHLKGTFTLRQQDWDTFYNRLEKHLNALPPKLLKQPYAADILELTRREIALYRTHRGYYGYDFYIMQNQ